MLRSNKRFANAECNGLQIFHDTVASLGGPIHGTSEAACQQQQQQQQQLLHGLSQERDAVVPLRTWATPWAEQWARRRAAAGGTVSPRTMACFEPRQAAAAEARPRQAQVAPKRAVGGGSYVLCSRSCDTSQSRPCTPFQRGFSYSLGSSSFAIFNDYVLTHFVGGVMVIKF